MSWENKKHCRFIHQISLDFGISLDNQSTMGAVCSAGTTMKKNPEFRENNSGFSGKLKSMRSFSKHRDNSYSHSDVDGFENISQNFDFGELRLSISHELKPSTPARTCFCETQLFEKMEDKKDGVVVWVAYRRGISTYQNSGFRSGVEEDISRSTNDFSTEQVLNKKFYFDQSETPAFVLWRECKLVSFSNGWRKPEAELLEEEEAGSLDI
ncbi:unnamed protein product [Camellia sinensis]